MSWKGDVGAMVRAEFQSAARLRRGVVERVSDEREAVRAEPSRIVAVRVRGRIVVPRRAEAACES